MIKGNLIKGHRKGCPCKDCMELREKRNEKIVKIFHKHSTKELSEMFELTEQYINNVYRRYKKLPIGAAVRCLKTIDNYEYSRNCYCEKCMIKTKLRNYEMVISRLKGYTLEQIALVYGVTRERVRQIEAHMFRRLRHPAYKIPTGDFKKDKNITIEFIRGLIENIREEHDYAI